MKREKDSFKNPVSDALIRSWVYNLLPNIFLPYAQLARWDRPIGWQLLMWPCFWSTTLAAYPLRKADLMPLTLLSWHLFLYCIDAIVMRGAGCTWNDLIDKDIDALVARTQSRPLPSGRISDHKAWAFMLAQWLIGFFILLRFNSFTIYLGLASLAILALYPFTKRFTNWPQFFLGLCFSWGGLMGWAGLHGQLSLPAISLYAATVCWGIGYDTIYAHQDKNDDELIGVGSTAKLFAEHTKIWLSIFYILFLILLIISFYLVEITIYGWIGLFIAAFLLARQITIFDSSDPDKCLVIFRSNTTIGLVIFIGLFLSLISI